MNTQHPRDDHGYGNAPTPPPTESQSDAESMNTYTRRYNDAAAPDLDAGAPSLPRAEIQRLNKRSMFFAGCLGLLAILVGIAMFGSGKRGQDHAAKLHQEMVTVPEAPHMEPQAPPKQSAAAIPLKTTPPPLPMPDAPPAQPVVAASHVPTLRERRMETANGFAAGGNSQANAQSAPPQLDASDATSAQPLNHPDALMLRGTYIRCVLETRIITDIPGFTSCVVTEPVYSFTGHTLLLPKGSKVLGKYSQEPNGPRVAVIWDRIVTPTGIDVNMVSPGVDNLGGAGHPGGYNAHWGSRIGAALMISLLSDAFKYEAAKQGPTQTTISNGVVTQTPFESNTAKTVQSIANQAVQRAANRPATVTINQGTVVNVYVARDVDFSGVVARF